MSRSVGIGIEDQNKYTVCFVDNEEMIHMRTYYTFAGASLDAKYWLTLGHEPTAQSELEELAI